ncbi:MAG TPA: DNA-3-methyladenine glycosylase I [Chthonomonadaceae bacterium]|nr:DNA-3-methyladenine glycosylase I [Chthonomonadaceae bacterium]
MSYCDYIQSDRAREPHISYHDTEYGFPSSEENVLFERLILEINQAGLSWETVLKKRPAFRAAFDGFDVERVAAYGDEDVARLLSDAGIIRNRLKVAAAIHNAGVLVALRPEFGSFHGWLEAHHPLPKAEWLKLFKRTFRFTGGEIVGEFLMSLGYLPGAHDATCPVGRRLLERRPPWSGVDPAIYGPAG